MPDSLNGVADDDPPIYPIRERPLIAERRKSAMNFAKSAARLAGRVAVT